MLRKLNQVKLCKGYLFKTALGEVNENWWKYFEKIQHLRLTEKLIGLSARKRLEVIFGISRTWLKSQKGPAAMHKILRYCMDIDEEYWRRLKRPYWTMINVLPQNIVFFIENEYSFILRLGSLLTLSVTLH